MTREEALAELREFRQVIAEHFESSAGFSCSVPPESLDRLDTAIEIAVDEMRTARETSEAARRLAKYATDYDARVYPKDDGSQTIGVPLRLLRLLRALKNTSPEAKP